MYRTLWLSESQVNALGALRTEANQILESEEIAASPEWIPWLDAIAQAAKSLLVTIGKKRKELRTSGETTKLINKSIAYIRENAKVDTALRKQLAESLGAYTVPTEITFDAKSSTLQRQLLVPQTPPVPTLRKLMLATAIHNGEWQLIRRCPLPSCRRFFCDTPGRRAMEYCPGTNHRRNHSFQKTKAGK